jgi:hypothetical protein
MIYQYPSPVIWPGRAGATAYEMQLSKAPNFPDQRTVTSELKPWCYYNHPKALPSGTYCWRYRAKMGGADER